MPRFSYVKEFTFKMIILRFIWEITYFFLFRITPRWCLNNWRVFLLVICGAKIGKNCKISPNCKVWAPWNLQIGNKTAIASNVDIYSMDKIIIGNNVTISQYAFICTGSHDTRTTKLPLKTKKIEISDYAWVCAKSIILPGCKIGKYSIVSAGSVCFDSVGEKNIVSGNPAKFLKKRKLN